MKSIKVILRQDVDTLGSLGEIVSVKPGYARNYLLPRGIAFEATSANLRPAASAVVVLASSPRV